MGSIPEYRRNPVASEVQTAKIDQADDLGRGIAVAAGAVEQVLAKQQQARDVAYVSSRAIDLETRATQRIQEWQNDNALDPIGKEENLQERIQRDLDEIGGDAPSDDARASLNRMGDDIKRRYSVHGAQWANQQLVKNIGDDIDRSSQALQLEAFRSSDPRALDDIFKKHDTLLVAASVSLSPDAVKNIQEVGKREIVSNMVQGMIDKDRLGDAQKMLDSKAYDEVLGADKTRQAYEMIQRKREANNNRNEQLLALKDSNPWKFLHEVGDSKAVKPVAFAGDPGSITKSFDAREAFVRDMNKKHGIQLPFLEPREADHFADSFKELNPRDGAALMSNLVGKTTEAQRALVGRQVFDKEPAITAALMISGHDADATRGILGGKYLLHKGPEGTGKPVNPPKASDIEIEFDSYLGQSIEDPNARIAIKDAATSLMTYQNFQRGKDTENFKPEDFQNAIARIVGPVAEINGRKTATFRKKDGKFVDENGLDELVGSLTDDVVEKVQGDLPRTYSGEPINLKKARGRMTLRAVADGKYWIMTDEGIAVDRNHQPFKLDLKAIHNSGNGAQKKAFYPPRGPNLEGMANSKKKVAGDF